MSFETRSKKGLFVMSQRAIRSSAQNSFILVVKKFQTQRFIWRDSCDRSGVRRLLNSLAQLCTPLLHWHLKSSLSKVYKAKCNKISPRRVQKSIKWRYFLCLKHGAKWKGFTVHNSTKSTLLTNTKRADEKRKSFNVKTPNHRKSALSSFQSLLREKAASKKLN